MKHVIKVNYGADIVKVIFDNLDIRAKTVGIGINDSFGTEESYEFYHGLCTQQEEFNFAIIPGNESIQNKILLPENVLGIYLHQGTSVDFSGSYDIWITVESGETAFNNVTFKSSLPDLLTESVIANQMKNVVSRVDTSKISDHPVDMLFSAKSMALRMPSDWWIEFPENTDQKLMTVNVLKYIQDNEIMFARIVRQVKDRIVDGTFGMGIILDFPEHPNVKATMKDGSRGKFVIIRVGMVRFCFSTERTMFLDWQALMIDQLDELAGE